MQKSVSYKIKIFIIIIIIIVILFLSIILGSISINPINIINIKLHKIFNTPLKEDITKNTVSIIWLLRIPRVCLAFLIGAALSTSGCILQSTLKNPLASSYTLGVSSGAALGASIAMIINFQNRLLGMFTIPIFGLIFAMLTIAIVIIFSSKVDKQISGNTIILSGVVFSIFINSLQALLMSFSQDNIKNIIFWQMGSFSFKGFEYILILLPIMIICILFLYSKHMELDILTFGEESALSIGIDQKKMKWVLIFVSAVLTGVSVSFVGIIGFIDLIAPHITRKIFGSSHKLVIVASSLIGGIFMVFADMISRVIIAPEEIPVGIVTSLLGAPFFGYIYFRGNKK